MERDGVAACFLLSFVLFINNIHLYCCCSFLNVVESVHPLGCLAVSESVCVTWPCTGLFCGFCFKFFLFWWRTMFFFWTYFVLAAGCIRLKFDK